MKKIHVYDKAAFPMGLHIVLVLKPTAGTNYISFFKFSNFLLAYCISIFKHGEDKMCQ